MLKIADGCNDNFYALGFRWCTKCLIQQKIFISLWTTQALDAGSTAGELTYSDERSNCNRKQIPQVQVVNGLVVSICHHPWSVDSLPTESHVNHQDPISLLHFFPLSFLSSVPQYWEQHTAPSLLIFTSTFCFLAS